MGPDTLAKVARKRRRLFPSRSEALAKYARRPPFDTFSPACLEAYGTYGFKDVPGQLFNSSVAGASSPSSCPHAQACPLKGGKIDGLSVLLSCCCAAA